MKLALLSTSLVLAAVLARTHDQHRRGYFVQAWAVVQTR
jgi:hypothetical protein